MTGEGLQRLFDEGEARDGGADRWLSVGAALLRGVGWRYDPEGEVERQLELACADAWGDDNRDKIRASFAKGLPRCESPIERLLLPWLIGQRYQAFDYNPQVLLPGEGEQLKDHQIAVVPQLPIGAYRVDFALATKRGGPSRFIVVEADGAAFHDAVDQVKRDVNRDVRILGHPNVLDLIRLDGRDIVRNPKEAAARAARAVLEAWAKPRPCQ